MVEDHSYWSRSLCLGHSQVAEIPSWALVGVQQVMLRRVLIKEVGCGERRGTLYRMDFGA